MKKNQIHQCPVCLKKFPTSKGLSIHKTRLRHWSKPTPPPVIVPEPRRHVNFRDLVSDSYRTWGKTMSKQEAEHPTLEVLSLSALFEIIELLHELIKEVKRPR